MPGVREEVEGAAASSSHSEVFRVTWMPEDHQAELIRILQGVDAHSVERKLMQYVEESIEPAGWRAVWRCSPDPANLSSSPCYSTPSKPADFIVDVVNVSRDKLEADVKVVGAVKNEEEPSPPLPAEFTVSLLELYPLVDQENSHLDMTTTAEVVEQIRFFYQHIWRAWDLEEENCHYDTHLITSRLSLYQDVQAMVIPPPIASQLRTLLKKAEHVQREIKKIELENEVNMNEQEGEVEEKCIARLFQLHRQIEQLKARFELLQNPVFRELTVQESHVDSFGVELLNCGRKTPRVRVVGDSLPLRELTQQVARLPQVLKGLPGVLEEWECQLFPSLQLALDVAAPGDVVLLLSGTHPLSHLGLLSMGGTLMGLGEEVVVVGHMEAGDVLMHVSGDLRLENVQLEPALGQLGLVQHKGSLNLTQVTLRGGSGGVLGLAGTHCKLEQVQVLGATGIGLDWRQGCEATVCSTQVRGCSVGVQLQQGALVTMSSCNVVKNTSHGILATYPQEDEATKVDTCMTQLLHDYRENTVLDNGEDFGMKYEKYEG